MIVLSSNGVSVGNTTLRRQNPHPRYKRDTSETIAQLLDGDKVRGQQMHHALQFDAERYHNASHGIGAFDSVATRWTPREYQGITAGLSKWHRRLVLSCAVREHREAASADI